MATVLFTSEPGVAIALYDGTVLPITLTVQYWAGLGTSGYLARNAIITGVTVSSRGTYQFQQTLRNFVYVYVFGERMGDVTIHGLTFMSNCVQCYPPSSPDCIEIGQGFSGISMTADYYDAWKATGQSNVPGIPLGISFGLMSLLGFLTGFNISLTDPKSRIGKFTLNFKTTPW